MEKTLRRNKLVYVIGPFRAETDYVRIMNIRAAEAMSHKLWLMGFTVICVHMNTMNMEGLVPDADILAGDIVIMEKCDFAVTSYPMGSMKMLTSAGSQAEIERCKVFNIPVYSSNDMKIIEEQEG